MMRQGKPLIDGEARGEVLRLTASISFWGGVDPASGVIIQGHHPERGICITDMILVIPALIGSSSSSAVMLELLYSKRSPRALLLGQGDAILSLGVVVAREMGFGEIPVVECELDGIETGNEVWIEAGGKVHHDPVGAGGEP